MSGVTESLNNIFEKHRLVFWYDPNGEMREEYDQFVLEGGEKVEVANNQFGLKHRMIREDVEKQFLLYMPYERPSHPENWFLDLELGNHVFSADGTSMILQEMGWLTEHRSFAEKYKLFFKSKERKEKLKEKMDPDDREPEWQTKMIACLVREEGTIENVLFALLADLCDGDGNAKYALVEKYELTEFLWKEVEKKYKYFSEQPSVLDFAIEAFTSAAPLGEDPSLGREAKLFISRWKNNSQYADAFEKLSNRLEKELSISDKVSKVEQIEELKDQDAFEVIEKKFIVGIRDGMLDSTIGLEKLKGLLDTRVSSFWYKKYGSLYRALLDGAKMLDAIKKSDLGMSTIDQAFANYAKNFYKIDQLYRSYVYHASRSNQATLLDKLTELVEKHYSNNFLLKLNDRFQRLLDEEDSWPPAGVETQTNFFKECIKPVISDKKKLFVVISDALRFEVAEELNRRILSQDRFTSSIEYRASTLPSYTQLGMAALLPHEKLEVDPTSGECTADGMSTKGLDARKKVLEKNSGVKATAILAKDFLKLNSNNEGRELSREHDLIYIYNNGIDAAGDKLTTQHTTFEAVENELETLLAILKKIGSINGNNALVTADHGFLFNSDKVEDSDFTANPTGNEEGVTSRRYAIGRGLEQSDGYKTFSSASLGLEGEAEFAIPKSINRFKVKGSGSQYVHGGASLQEIVIPVLKVNKARSSDVEIVEVDVLNSGSRNITTGQKVLTFYQIKPISEKLQARELKLGFYSANGDLLSDVQTVAFDSPETEERIRERKLVFAFTKDADNFHGKEVDLVMEEKIKGSNRFRVYKKETYRFLKSFETDFE